MSLLKLFITPYATEYSGVVLRNRATFISINLIQLDVTALFLQVVWLIGVFQLT